MYKINYSSENLNFGYSSVIGQLLYKLLSKHEKLDYCIKVSMWVQYSLFFSIKLYQMVPYITLLLSIKFNKSLNNSVF